jgi:hypothetical protein
VARATGTDDSRVSSCAAPARDASPLTRARAFVACRPCVAGWALYLAVAILLVVFTGAR